MAVADDQDLLKYVIMQMEKTFTLFVGLAKREDLKDLPIGQGSAHSDWSIIIQSGKVPHQGGIETIGPIISIMELDAFLWRLGDEQAAREDLLNAISVANEEFNQMKENGTSLQ